MSRHEDTNKAEFDWLCLDEGKPMKEIRGILKSCRRSNAPDRANRAWKEEWAVQKHRKRGVHPLDERLIRATMVPGSPSTNSNSRMTNHMLRFGHDIAIPSSPMEAIDVLAYIQGHSTAPYALEILLTKWQPGGAYLKLLVTVLKMPEYCEWIPRLAGNGRPLVFNLIEEHVPHEEQLTVGKLLLEAHLPPHRTPACHDAYWLTAWTTACHCTEWEEANEILYCGNRVATLAGDVFLDCARAAIAEQMLKRYIQDFRAWKMRGRWPTESNLHDAEGCRQKYLTILEECRDANLTLQPSFYRDSLEIIEAEWPFVDSQQQARSMDLANECRHKYLQLVSDSGKGVCYIKSVADDMRDIEEDESVKARREDTPFGTQDSRPSDIRPSMEMESPIVRSETGSASSVGEPERSSNPLSEQRIAAHKTRPPTPNGTANTLIDKWLSLKGFNTYVYYLLQQEGLDVSIFDPKLPGADSLFDIIHEYVPTSQHLSLTKAILVAFSTANFDLCRHPSSLAWWLTLFSAPSWKELECRLESQEVDKYLKPAMSPGAVQLVLNATIVLVGERLLCGLKTEMAANRGWKATGGDSVRYRATFNQFMDIWGELRKRDLSVDGAWLSHVLNMM